ncbi:MAG: hemolysin family protein [Coriobacteriales bacterium]|nr:hemolysin family protein [Actinomycetes bacterium]
MTAITILEIVVLVLVALVVAVLSAATGAVRLMSRGRIHRLVESERQGAQELERLAEREGHLIAASALARACMYAYGVTVGVVWLVRLDREPLAIVVAVALTLVLFSVAETLPRAFAVHNPEGVALASARYAGGAVALLYPVARALGAGWLALAGLVAKERMPDVWLTDDEYRAAAGSADEEETARDEVEEAFIEAVSDFGTKIVREVMVPRTDIVSVEDTASVSEALAIIEESGVSRVPIFHDTIDDIRGVLYAKDLLVCLGRGGCDSITAIARRPYFVPETKPLDELLFEMRTRTHIAIVADEYGGTAGLVTIEDLLEEIVGEIFDEYDVAEEMMVDLGDGRVRVDARMPVDDLNAAFGTDIEPEADSVGGLFVELAGHIPEQGEALEVEGLRMIVERMEGNRLRQLIVEPAANAKESSG